MTTATLKNNAAYETHLDDQMQRAFDHPKWSAREKVAISCRILAEHGHASGLAGQVTARADPGDGAFWTQTFGLGLEEAAVSNVICVDRELRSVNGRGMPNPGNRFHVWIYDQRPQVDCIVHTHALYTSALSMLGEPLAVSHMDVMGLYEDCAFLEKWPGVPNGDEEGELISRSLGDKRAILLANHGLLVACKSIEEATLLAVSFERAARLHLLARSVGEIRHVEPEHGRYGHEWKCKQKVIDANFHYYARTTLARHPACLK